MFRNESVAVLPNLYTIYERMIKVNLILGETSNSIHKSLIVTLYPKAQVIYDND